MKINIGCGMDYREGWLNTDISLKVKTDYLTDIRIDKLFAKDGEAEQVYCSGLLEQILENEHLVHAMNEMWRVLKKGGVAEIVVPNAEHSIAFQDPFDVRKFTPMTFKYFVEGEPEYENYGEVYGFKPWSSCNIEQTDNGILKVKLVK